MIRDREKEKGTVKICEDKRERERRVRGCDGRRRRIDKSWYDSVTKKEVDE